jgi:transcriptional regulator with XRE-family HTH domain
MTFAEKLKELRVEAGLTQAGLAEVAGRGLGAIRDYEQGNREPLLSTGFQLAKALGVSVEAFADCDFADGVPKEKPRGRPKKEPAAEKPKRSRGRPRKEG